VLRASRFSDALPALPANTFDSLSLTTLCAISHSCANPKPPHGLSAEAVRAEWLQALLVGGVWVLVFQLLVPVSLKQSLVTWCSKKFQVHRLGGLAFLVQCVPWHSAFANPACLTKLNRFFPCVNDFSPYFFVAALAAASLAAAASFAAPSTLRCTRFLAGTAGRGSASFWTTRGRFAAWACPRSASPLRAYFKPSAPPPPSPSCPTRKTRYNKSQPLRR
jgi:hypothetical protein